MQLPKIFQGEWLTRLIQGAVAVFRNSCHRLRMGRMDARKHGHENGESKRQQRGRDSARANLRR